MKFLHTLLFMFILIGLRNCSKTSNEVITPTEILKAKAQFEKQFSNHFPSEINSHRISEPRSPDWSRSKIMKQEGKHVFLVPIKYEKNPLIKTSFSNDLYLLSDISFLLIDKNPKGEFEFRMATVVPNSQIQLNSFSGIILVESWDGTPKYSYKYDGGKKFLSETSNKEIRTEGVIVKDNYINGYNFSPDDPDGGYAWQEFVGSTYIYVPEYYGGGGSFGEYQDPWLGGISEVENDIKPTNLIVPAGENKISNLLEYTKCFSNTPGSEYEVTIYIEQPIPGSRLPWVIYDGTKVIKNGTMYSVGHTFIGIRQKNAATTTVRNVGYYPSAAVTPVSPSTKGELDNDEDGYYDISLTISINQAQINNILSYLKNAENSTYNLNTYNCTTFALDCLRSAGINLPRTEGSWPNGKGLNPADLGEDIRAMKLSSNMTRKTKNESHKNSGVCN